MGKEEIAFLGADTVYEGKLSFKGTVRVEGRFTGEIISDGTLNVGKDACVDGVLQVGELLLSGRFNGEVTAKRRVVVYPTGILEGVVQSPALLTEEGGIIEGQVRMKTSGKNAAKTPEGSKRD
ncbi:MAG: polymer-forming cytoskeletal protein [Desulfovibrio sp.]|jgi:cytoskeletal protein CcmA (bactofilin family)|nr:polymer-forming cytoskeletal protein [Desulfovibrio sp.]